MPDSPFPIGRRISLPGHFAEPVALESVRPLPGLAESTTPKAEKADLEKGASK